MARDEGKQDVSASGSVLRLDREHVCVVIGGPRSAGTKKRGSSFIASRQATKLLENFLVGQERRHLRQSLVPNNSGFIYVGIKKIVSFSI